MSDPASSRARTALEIQIHPASIRRGVRYFFLTRSQLVACSVAAGLWLVLLLFGLSVAPWVAGGLLRRHDFEAARSERQQLGGRLQELTGQLGELGTRADDLHHKMARVYLAYGLSGEPSVGQGGYPYPVPAEPESIYSVDIHRGNTIEARIRERLQVLGVFLVEAQRFESEHADQVRSTPSVSPLAPGEFVLTSPFGTRRSPFTREIDFHAGLDLAAPVGAEIRAPADGSVVYAGRYPLRQSVAWWRYGNMVAVRHGERFITLYGHCDEVRVRRGQEVRQGDVLATVGDTGWSTSPHLHYEIRYDDGDGEFRPVDPRIYILDYRWRDEEQLLVGARRAPAAESFEPLPRALGR